MKKIFNFDDYTFKLMKNIFSKRDLREMEQRLVIKLGAMIAASIAITVTLLKLF